MSGIKHGPYEIYPYGQQIYNDDNVAIGWMALASVLRWQGQEPPLVLPVSWYPPLYATEVEAKNHAVAAAKNMIDNGRCKI